MKIPSATKTKQHKTARKPKVQRKAKVSKQSRPFSTQALPNNLPPTPVYRPFGGLAELKNSNIKLNIPVGNDVTLSRQEVLKLTQLSYLNPPQDDAAVEKITQRVGKMVNWLSTITHIDESKLPHLTLIRAHQAAQREETNLYKQDVTKIPYFTPLQTLQHVVPPQVMALVEDNLNSTADQTSLLRLRNDNVTLPNVNDVIRNAQNSQYNFYLAPKSKDDGE